MMDRIFRARILACAAAIAVIGCASDRSHERRVESARQVLPRALARSASRGVPDAPAHWDADVPTIHLASAEQPRREKSETVERARPLDGLTPTARLGGCRPMIRLANAETVPDVPAPKAIDDQPPEIVAAPAESPPLVSGDVTPLDLSSALVMAAGRNPQVAFAQERILAAQARNDGAKAMWLPSLRAGMNWYKHDGTLQDVRGPVSDISRTGLYTGMGARAIGAANPAVPGVSAQFHVTDAVFQPKITSREQHAAGWNAQAARNDVMLDTAVAYLQLLSAWQHRAVTEQTLGNADALAVLTSNFASSGQGPQADADRAATELALRRNAHEQAGEAVRTASARLAELLSLDPTVTIVPQEDVLAPVDLISGEQSAQELVCTALQSRPELQQNANLVAAATERLKREKYAPLLPSVLLGASYGGFGGGTGDTITNYRDRFDVEATAFWEVRNLGHGEKAARDEAESQVRQAQFRQMQLMDRVAREVVEAHAQVTARRRQIDIAQTGVSAAEKSYQRNRDRIRDGQGVPLEVLQSLQALDQSRREYIRTVVQYNEAQFRLQRALGWPIN